MSAFPKPLYWETHVITHNFWDLIKPKTEKKLIKDVIVKYQQMQIRSFLLRDIWAKQDNDLATVTVNYLLDEIVCL